MRKTREEAEETRRQILEAAKRVFERKGYNATRLEDIAREINMTRGVIYWHFKNKTDLFLQLVNQSVDEAIACFHKTFESTGDLSEKLRAILFEVPGEIHFFELIKSFHPAATEIDSKSRWAAMSVIQQRMKEVFNPFVGFLKEKQKEGRISKDSNAEAFATAFFLVTAMLNAPDPGPEMKGPMFSMRRKHRQEITNLLWNGLESALTD